MHLIIFDVVCQGCFTIILHNKDTQNLKWGDHSLQKDTGPAGQNLQWQAILCWKLQLANINFTHAHYYPEWVPSVKKNGLYILYQSPGMQGIDDLRTYLKAVGDAHWANLSCN